MSLWPCCVFQEEAGLAVANSTCLAFESHVISWLAPTEQSVSQETALVMTLVAETAQVLVGCLMQGNSLGAVARFRLQCLVIKLTRIYIFISPSFGRRKAN